ncbi:hypothetical protein [Bacillus wiedmannii]
MGKNSEIYYTDPSSGKVTHIWNYNPILPGGGQVMAVPSKLYPGLGWIHHPEKSAGVWGNDQKYAERLEK